MLSFFLLASTLTGLQVAATSPIVALQYGVFQGKADGNLSTFLGIPFAAPAVRFTLPMAPTSLHGVQNATEFGPACPQQALTPTPPGLSVPNRNYTSEDCLTLNVFTPRSAGPHSNLPVFVVRGFEVGGSADQDVRPIVEHSIATGEPIIVVTPNYRVSAFGFLAGKEVADAGITNLGMRDQIFALEWVQQHIATFGGDPERIVIGGVSAGAISVALLLLDNKRFEQSTLFRGAFMVCGSPITTPSVAQGQSDYDGLVTANNCRGANDTLECLRRVPLDSFQAAVNNTANIFSFQSLNLVWRPRVDGEVIVHNPLVSVSKGLFAKIPIISGDADDEGTLFSFSNSNITTNDEFMDYIHSNYLPHSTAEQIAEVSVLYPDDPAEVCNSRPQFNRLAAFQGDWIFMSTRRFVLEHASKTQNTWSYLSKHGKSTPFVGASHGSDMALWFPAANATDHRSVDALINFINTLDPNGSASSHGGATSDIVWPKWDSASVNGFPLLLTFSDPNMVNVTAEDFRVDAMKFLYGLLLGAAETSAWRVQVDEPEWSS
ncbi:sterol esterase [Mycena pura]|uniref:Carboxylic ester hydrolase n=1 Tax=Mycena pura TaxID=153505 RepID=A0AAD6Y624_9AGAR|nr:sterol esterase [Mycena pura]